MRRRPLVSRRALRDECGAYAILYGLVVVVIVMTAAIVIDLSSMREDRRIERLAADAAATAGAMELNALAGSANAQSACLKAWSYLKANLPDAGSATPECPLDSFPDAFTACPDDVRSVTSAAGPWAITITWPVPDDDPLMTDPNVTGRAGYTQPLDPEVDGNDACGRIGVSVGRDREFVLAGAGGFFGASTQNASVARADDGTTFSLEMPLVVLDQSGCEPLQVDGGSSIIVRNNGITPGRIAIDSTGAECGTSHYVMVANGSTNKIRAYNGDSGAQGRIFTVANPYDKAANFAADVCDENEDPALTSHSICPRPVPFIQITRKYWDWPYHCTTATTAPLSAPCTTGEPDHIGDLQDAFQEFTRSDALADSTNWELVEGAACRVRTPTQYVDGKNVFVNCPNFKVEESVTFGGNLVIFAGDVTPEGPSGSPACIRFNYAGVGNPCDPVTARRTDEMRVYLKNGNLTRRNINFVAPETFIYQDTSIDENVVIDFGTGSAGRVYISAPTNDTKPFFNLAIWSENCAGRSDASPSDIPCDGDATPSSTNGLGSSTQLTLEGIFFFPNADVKLGGQPGAVGIDRSQFVAWTLRASGGAEFGLVPNPEFTLEIPVGGVQLIR